MTSEELRTWCRDQGLSSIKVPGRVELFAELPKNQVGKFDKRAIASRLGPDA